jgi:hypothetical protein
MAASRNREDAENRQEPLQAIDQNGANSNTQQVKVSATERQWRAEQRSMVRTVQRAVLRTPYGGRGGEELMGLLSRTIVDGGKWNFGGPISDFYGRQCRGCCFWPHPSCAVNLSAVVASAMCVGPIHLLGAKKTPIGCLSL